MTHEHGREYRAKIALEDETEVLSGWTNCQEQVAQALTGFYGSPAKDRWLQVRNILCLDCVNRGLMTVEYPLILIAAEDIDSHHKQKEVLAAPPQAAHFRAELNGRSATNGTGVATKFALIENQERLVEAKPA